MGRPEIIINIASSLDGMIAAKEGPLSLSTEEDWIRVHKLRNTVDAILVGVNTILIDNPLLTIRYVKPKPNPPFRVVLDTTCKIPLDSQVLLDQDYFPTIIVTSKDAEVKKKEKLLSLGVKIIEVSKEESSDLLSLPEVLDKLYSKFKIRKLLVEGGSKIISEFLENDFMDKMYVFFAPVFIGEKKGVPLFSTETSMNLNDTMKFVLENITKIDEGILVELKLKKMRKNEN